jgi:hypothetical protein
MILVILYCLPLSDSLGPFDSRQLFVGVSPYSFSSFAIWPAVVGNSHLFDYSNYCLTFSLSIRFFLLLRISCSKLSKTILLIHLCSILFFTKTKEQTFRAYIATKSFRDPYRSSVKDLWRLSKTIAAYLFILD